MNQNNIVALSALKTFYDNSKDVIGLYGDVLFVATYNTQSVFSLSDIQGNVQDKFGLTIPIDMVKTIAKRFSREHYLSYKAINKQDVKSISFTEKGKNKQSEIKEQFEKIRREENEVLEKICEKTPSIKNTDHAKKLLKDFIYHHPYMATNILIQNGSDGNNDHSAIDGKTEQCIRNFFIQSEESDPASFEYLKKLLFGQVIASNLLDTKNSFSLKKVNIYIDSNIFFSLLGLHDKNTNQSVSEVINLIKENSGNIKIFEHTKNEICQLLKGFLSHRKDYVTNIPVNSIYHTMLKKHYDAHKVRSLITNISEKLDEYKIQIHYEREEEVVIDHAYFAEFREEKGKLDKHQDSIDYDCQSITRIRSMRKNINNCYHIHKCRVLFLTSDKILARFSKGKHQQTIPEVMMHYELTGILWLNSVGSAQNKFIHSCLSQSVITQTVSLKVWNNFIEKLKTAEESGDINRQEINELLAHENTKNILLEGKPEKIAHLINPENIKGIQKEIREDKEQTRQLKQELNKKNIELDQQNLDATTEREKILSKISEKCKKRVDKSTETIIVSLTVVVGMAFVIWILFEGFSLVVTGLAAVVTGLAVLCPIFGYSFRDWKLLRDKLDDYRSSKIDACIEQEMKELGIKSD